jgi:hypothetical protein
MVNSIYNGSRFKIFGLTASAPKRPGKNATAGPISPLADREVAHK